MATVALLENEVKHMRCALCDHFLSVPPIMTISDDGNENQCACGVRQAERVAAERMLQRTSGLSRASETLLPWNEVEEHERSCTHKTIQCPLYYQRNCAEVVKISEFEVHMNTTHRSNTVYGETVREKISNSMSSVYYLVPDEGRFIVYITPEVIFVGSLVTQRKYSKYTVKLTANDCEDKSLVFDNVRIVEYDDRAHCYKCLNGKCNLVHHPFSKANRNARNPDFLHSDKELLMEFLQEPAVISMSLTLLPEGAAEALDAALLTTMAINSAFLSIYLKCVVCDNYMTGKVFQCDIGHVFCAGCAGCECVICEKSPKSRCYIAESLAYFMVFSCLKRGCSFLGGLNELVSHEMNCKEWGD